MSSLPPDPYKILGVSKDAQLPEIRSAHRKLVLKCHPDKVQDPTLKAAKQDEFQKVQQAYELLSDENERLKYDENVKLAELRKEMAAKGMTANTSAPRARTFDVNIRTAEPRPDTFRTTSSYRAPTGGKLYSQYPSSRSYEEEIHRAAPGPTYEPRRAASYEKSPRQEDERDRERERRRRKEEERERERADAIRAADRKERERQAEKERADRRAAEKAADKAAKRAADKAAEEKEARRQQRKALEKAEKDREKERRHLAEDKSRRHKAAYIESYDDDETYSAPKSEKKKSSSSKKYEEKEKKERARSIPREAVREEQPAPPLPDPTKSKVNEAMSYAASYMEFRKGAPVARAQTFSGFEKPAAPTPPIVASAPFPPPPAPVPSAEEDLRPKVRRSSETKPRDKSSHKKSPAKESPYVVEASPTSRPMPQYSSTQSSPIGGSPPKHLGRSSTFNEAYVRPVPGLPRAHTYHHGGEADPRGRGRSRMHPQISEDSDSDDDYRHARRGHRHRVLEPEPIPLDYNQGRSTRYTVSGTRTIPLDPIYSSYHREESPTRKGYYDRPSMPPRESSYSSSGFGKVKTSRGYTVDDVQYSNIPHRYRADEYAY